MADWIIVADDDINTLREADAILSEAGMNVTALESGRSLLDYVREHGCPDLILLDIDMSEMDGFETLDLFRKESDEAEKVPVVFLTAEEESSLETRSFASGAMDYIRKPFNPEVLVSRVRKILEIRNTMLRIEKDAETDQLTGFLNKNAAEAKMAELCRTERGLLCVLDLDSFKSVNDLYGHDAGDRILTGFSDLIKKDPGFVTDCGRIGGDEFLVFSRHLSRESDLAAFSDRINREYTVMAEEALGGRPRIPIGVSIGAVAVPEYGTDYAELFHLADLALFDVKKNGKHGYRLYEAEEESLVISGEELDLETVTAILEERRVSPNAMWMGREVFSSIYHYMVRYMDRYHSSAYRVLYTVRVKPEGEGKRSEIIARFKETVRNTLRNSDVMMECGDHQVFLLLPEIQDYDIDRVLDRLLANWRKSGLAELADVFCEFGKVHTASSEEEQKSWIVAVDDEEEVRSQISCILTERGMNVTGLSSGEELLGFLRENQPGLVLLDTEMPGMDGIETLKRIKREVPMENQPPVLLVSETDDPEMEDRGLRLGAADILKKPFGDSILIHRVENVLEMTRLQRTLSAEVMRKTRESETFSLQAARALMEAIDEKDRTTKGHSSRTAEYAREIAQRYGYSWGRQNEVYLMGLLHDAGMMHVPDEILNKPDRLNEEEFAVIRTHAERGAGMLSQIVSMPALADGARWHHERFDGTGYPDGLAGSEIPEAVRILSVADAYDAMTSHRSYRDILPQAEVRRELETGKGTQFDPVFADIMIAIMDEDPDYLKKEPQ